MKQDIKKETEVVIIAGRDKNKRGRVLSIDREKGRVLVEGINMRKRHLKKTQNDTQGGIIEREASLHISNIMSAERFEARRAKKTSK